MQHFHLGWFGLPQWLLRTAIRMKTNGNLQHSGPSLGSCQRVFSCSCCCGCSCCRGRCHCSCCCFFFLSYKQNTTTSSSVFFNSCFISQVAQTTPPAACCLLLLAGFAPTISPDIPCHAASWLPGARRSVSHNR